MKRIALLLTGLLLLSLLAVACGGGAATPPAQETAPTEAPAEEAAPTEAPAEEAAGDCTDEAVLCIGLVTDVGEVDDKSFNQSAWEGAQQAAEALGAAEVNFIETSAATDYGANIALFADQGYDVIVTVGFAMGEATLPRPPHILTSTLSAWISSNPKHLSRTSLAGLQRRQGGIFGWCTGRVSQPDRHHRCCAGYRSGSGCKSFNIGYQNGALSVNPDIKVIATYHPGGFESGFTSPEDGAATAQQAIANGADFVFGAGGKTGNGAIIEAASHEGVWCIGVDSDQWGTVPEAHPCLITSAMKLITPGVVDLITKSVNGEFPGGNYYGWSVLRLSMITKTPFHKKLGIYWPRLTPVCRTVQFQRGLIPPQTRRKIKLRA